jgi:hypothetical protein
MTLQRTRESAFAKVGMRVMGTELAEKLIGAQDHDSG